MSTPSGDSGEGEGEVVLRKGHRSPCTSRVVEALKEGERRVKWSESTDLREKMKEYRRSQLSMTLDYHHIAVEESREREGVKQWRESLQKHEVDQLNQEPEDSDKATEEGGGKEEEDENDDTSDEESDEFHPAADEDLELKVRVIKAASTKYTWLPAYRAAVDVYEPWLASHRADLPEDQAKIYEEQCQMYAQVLQHYQQWPCEDKPGEVDAGFDRINSLLEEAKALGDPPDCVTQAINEELTRPANVQQQKEMYERLVNQLVTDFAGALSI